MKKALIYTGYLRSWEHVRGDHKENLKIDKDTSLYFYTYELPTGEVIRDSKQFSFTQVPEPFYPDPFKEHKYNARKRPENTVYQTLNQWHNNFVGFCMVPRGYDVYVRVRTDIKFNGPVNFENYDILSNNIYIPEGNDYGGINDQFAFGNYDVMKKYYSVYLNCHQLWEDGVEWHSEGMQLSNLNREGVNIVRFGSPQQHIVR